MALVDCMFSLQVTVRDYIKLVIDHTVQVHFTEM